ncbi:MAG: hypothetical protein FWE67_11255 [Planctomycetaceae bacterium]|nr:hypothetical protein [Planctomycetaceae bacterium]
MKSITERNIVVNKSKSAFSGRFNEPPLNALANTAEFDKMQRIITRRQTFQNTLYTHDNLYVLSGLNSGLVIPLKNPSHF